MSYKSATSIDFDEQIIGDSLCFQQVLNQVRIVAPTDSVTLIQGETGTGKEVIARAIRLSGWADLGSPARVLETLTRNGIEPEWVRERDNCSSNKLSGICI